MLEPLRWMTAQHGADLGNGLELREMRERRDGPAALSAVFTVQEKGLLDQPQVPGRRIRMKAAAA